MMCRTLIRWSASIVDPVPDDDWSDVHLESGEGNWTHLYFAALLIGVAAILLSAFRRQRRNRRHSVATGRTLLNVVTVGLLALLMAAVLLVVYFGI